MKHIRSSSSFVSKARLGFSLVEIMVVLVIIGLLAGVVSINVRGYLLAGKQNTARMEIATIVSGLETFHSLNDRYPTNDEGLRILTESTQRMPEPPLTKMPIDPWRRPYIYNQPGRSGPYEVYSQGADGQDGGDPKSADADITSWDIPGDKDQQW